MIKPIIGIIPTYVENDGHIYEEYDKYMTIYGRRVKEAGGVPVGLIIEDDILPEQLEMCDGFIIQGGHKIRRFVYQVIDYAIKNNKPLLGICMGSEAIDIYSVVADNVSIPTGPPVYFKIIVSNIFLSILSKPNSSISNFLSVSFASFKSIFPSDNTKA